MTIMNFVKKIFGIKMNLDDEIIQKYCKGKGVEIGGSAHNEFQINALNIDISRHDNPEDEHAITQMKYAKRIKKVDIIADGCDIPLKDNSVNFVFSCHVIEHFFDPISAINEWLRIVKTGKCVVMVIPNKELTYDKDRECSTIEDIENRHKIFDKNVKYEDKHHSVWTPERFLELMKYYKYNVVAYSKSVRNFNNSFCVAIKKDKNYKHE